VGSSLREIDVAENQGKRRLDRVLNPAFLEGLADLDIAELRVRRNDARSEEEELSFKRRMLQGRLEVLAASANQAASDSADLVKDIVAALTSGTSAGGTTGGNARAVSLDPPVVGEEEARGRRYLERLLRDVDWSTLSQEGSDRMEEITGVLREQEELISASRTQVHRVIDALTAELGRRYREGGVRPPIG